MVARVYNSNKFFKSHDKVIVLVASHADAFSGPEPIYIKLTFSLIAATIV